jgi:hypothetical protein
MISYFEVKTSVNKGLKTQCSAKCLPKMGEATGQFVILLVHNGDFCDLCGSPDVIRMSFFMRLRWNLYVAWVVEARNEYSTLVWKARGK